MQLAYIRTSRHDQKTTLERLTTAASAEGWRIREGLELPSGGTVFQVCKPDWVDAIVSKDPNLFGLIPCSIMVLERAGTVTVGAGSAALLGKISSDPDLQQLSASAESAVRALVNHAAGVVDPKPVAVKLFSTKTCPYCRMEKAWLDSKHLAHTVAYVDEDQEEARRLVERTGQRGVPVTEIEFDDGEPEFVVGFDKSRLEAILLSN